MKKTPSDYFYLNNKNIKAVRNPTDGTMSFEDSARIRAMQAPLRVKIGTDRTMSIKQDIDVEKINKEVEETVDKLNPEWKKPGNCQILLQGCFEGKNDPYFGSRRVKELEDAGHEEKDFIFPIFDMPYTNKLIEQLKMFRTRLMLLKPKSCLSWHYDPGMRIHIPLYGDSDSFHIIEDIDGNKVVHQIEPTGGAHLMNTEVYHTGINLSMDVDRCHIVGCVNVD